jgi:hypothetical protein
MTSGEKITEQEARRQASKWVSESRPLRKGGQYEALMIDLAKQCVTKTLATDEGEWELESRLVLQSN